MPSKKFMEWMAFHELEPFGQKRMDYRFASVVAALLNVHRDPKVKSKPWTIEDTVMRFGDDAETSRVKTSQTWQDQKLLISAFVSGWNATVQQQEK